MNRARAIFVLSLALTVAACAQSAPRPPVIDHADAERGRDAVARLQCGACHRIPGVRAARGTVGPPLEAFAHRVYLAGKFPNDADHLVRWLLDPPALAPHTAMPALVADETTARDIAAFLYSLD
jgi:cytochrome c2